MNLTININIPEKLTADSEKSAADMRMLRPPTGASGKPKEEDYQPDGTPMIPLQGPPIAMLLFALTRATTTDVNTLMTPAQATALNDNVAFYNIFKGFGASAVFVGNGITVFQRFFAAHPEFVATLQAAQAMYPVFKRYITDAGIWDDSCELKYSQLANMANIDWQGME